MARRTATAAAPPPELPPGTLIARGAAPGRATPWCAPTMNRKGFEVPKPARQRLAAWQAEVNLRARAAAFRRGPLPYAGPVDLNALVYLKPGGNPPDRDNVQKALSDALEGAVYTNDRNIRGGEVRLIFDADQPERVEWAVSVAE